MTYTIGLINGATLRDGLEIKFNLIIFSGKEG